METNLSDFKNNKDINENIDIIKDINNKKYCSLLKEIDKVINKSKNQLEEIKSKNEKDYKVYRCDKTKISILTNDSSSKNNNINNKSFNKKQIIAENEEINEKMSNNKDNNNNNLDKDFELQRINTNLRADLAVERAKVRELSLKLKIKDKEIASLKQQLNYTHLNFYNKQKQYENILANTGKNNTEENNNYLNKYSTSKQNSMMIKSFFDFFNKHIELFNQLSIINNNNMILYNENDINNINFKNSKLVINTLDKLIEKFSVENKEFSEQKMKFKENKNDIINISNNFDDIKNDKNIIDKINPETIDNKEIESNSQTNNIQNLKIKNEEI